MISSVEIRRPSELSTNPTSSRAITSVLHLVELDSSWPELTGRHADPRSVAGAGWASQGKAAGPKRLTTAFGVGSSSSKSGACSANCCATSCPGTSPAPEATTSSPGQTARGRRRPLCRGHCCRPPAPSRPGTRQRNVQASTHVPVADGRKTGGRLARSPDSLAACPWTILTSRSRRATRLGGRNCSSRMPSTPW